MIELFRDKGGHLLYAGVDIWLLNVRNRSVRGSDARQCVSKLVAGASSCWFPVWLKGTVPRRPGIFLMGLVFLMGLMG